MMKADFDNQSEQISDVNDSPPVSLHDANETRVANPANGEIKDNTEETADMKRASKQQKSPPNPMSEKKPETEELPEELAYRYDIVLWLFGMLFFAVLTALIFGIGAVRGWDAPSAYVHNTSNSSMERFLPEPFTPEPGVWKRSDPQASSRWYYWKLKPEDVTTWTKLFVWASYSLHNLSVWLVLYLQHKAKSFPDKDGKYDVKFTDTPDKYNLIMFGLNVFFHLLHLLNTHTTYDGTAADTSEASSQSSVIVAIIVMLFIEFRDRGVIFGYPSPYQLRKYQDSVWMSPVYLMRKYHGYLIYWAAIYTFWYHPMENTVGHISGFAHTWFFMLQGSLTFTKLHLNKYWRFTLEMWVTIHSCVVALQTENKVMGKELWPMFVFGFSLVIVLTQLYGLPFWKTIPAWTRTIPVALYAVIVVFAYNFVRDTQGRRFTRLSEIIRIPGIYYLILLIGWLIIVAITKIQRMRSANNLHSQKSSDTSLNAEKQPESAISRQLPMWKEILVLTAFVFTYVFSVFLSWILEYLDWQVNLIVLTMIYCFSFMLVSAIIGSFLLQPVLPMNRYVVRRS